MNSKSRTYILSIFNEISVRIPKQDLQDMFQEHQNLP